MVTLPIKVKSFLARSVIIYVATNLISSLTGQQWSKFHKTSSCLNKDSVRPKRGVDIRVSVIHIGSDDADTLTRGSFIFSCKFRFR